MWSQNLTRIVPFGHQAPLERHDLGVGAAATPFRWRSPRPVPPGPGRTTSGRRRPCPPSPGSAGKAPQEMVPLLVRRRSAPNWDTRTWRGSSRRHTRLIAPPLPAASQPSKTMRHGRAEPAVAELPPVDSRRCRSRRWARLTDSASSSREMRAARSTSSSRDCCDASLPIVPASLTLVGRRRPSRPTPR